MPISPDRWQDLSRIDMMDDNKRHYDTPLLVNIKGNRSPFLKKCLTESYASHYLVKDNLYLHLY